MESKFFGQAWRRLLPTPMFLRRQMFECFGVNDYAQVSDILPKTKWTFWRLDFYCTILNQFPRSFWKENGSKIYSIIIDNCTMDAETLKNIITYCVNLELLVLKSPCCTSTSTNGKKCSQHFVDVFDELLKNSVTNRKLTYLHINERHCNWLSNYVIRRLFVIFPNVKHLVFKTSADPRMTEQQPSIEHSKDKCTFSNILNVLRTRSDKMETLAILPDEEKLTYVPTELWAEIAQVDKLTNLTAIYITSNLEVLKPKTPAIEFFFKQKKLEHLWLSLICGEDTDVSQYDINNFLKNLLDECSELKFLKFFIDGSSKPDGYTIHIQNHFFDKLTASKVRHFGLYSENIVLDSGFVALKSKNRWLRILELQGAEEKCQRAFITVFQRLRNLVLHDAITDTMLQTISKYQTRLKTLNLKDCSNLTDYGFTGVPGPAQHTNDSHSSKQEIKKKTKFVNSKLTRLKNLSINKPIKLTELALTKFNLRFVYADIETNEQLHDSILRTIGTFSAVKVFSFRCKNISADLLFAQIISKLKNLVRVTIIFTKSVPAASTNAPRNGRFSYSDFQKLFQQCPSLRRVRIFYEDDSSWQFGLYLPSYKKELLYTTFPYDDKTSVDNEI